MGLSPRHRAVHVVFFDLKHVSGGFAPGLGEHFCATNCIRWNLTVAVSCGFWPRILLDVSALFLLSPRRTPIRQGAGWDPKAFSILRRFRSLDGQDVAMMLGN